MLDTEQTSQPPAAHNAKGFLSAHRLSLILRLRQEGKTQPDIAHFLGLNQSHVSRALQILGDDTSELARHHIKANSYKASRKVTALVEKGKDDVALKAAKLVLEGSGVISTTSTVQLGVQVLIGGEAQPAIDARSITVEVLETTPSVIGRGE